MQAEKRKKYLWIVLLAIAAAATVIRLYLAYQTPIYGLVTAEHDDMLMVRQAFKLAHLKWRGAYFQSTLVKGVSFPFFLAVSYVTGIKMTVLFVLFWAASCIVFLWAVEPSCAKKRWILVIVYILLLYHPALFNFWVGMRVYRNALTASQVLMIFGGLFGAFLRRKQGTKTMLRWMLYGSVGLVFFWYTREDSFWILPFMIVFTAVMAGLVLFEKMSVRRKAAQILVILLPFLCNGIAHGVQSGINAFAYGVPIVNEMSEGSFPKAMKLMYSIQYGEQPRNVSMTREKIRFLYECSPSLKAIEPYMEDLLDGWSVVDRVPDDLEVEDGWFFWCFRDSAAIPHYHDTLSHAQEYYEAVYQELQAAVDSGQAVCGMQMPSALMPPLHEGYLEELFPTIGQAMYRVFLLDQADTGLIKNGELADESLLSTEEDNALIERVTHNKLLSTSLRTPEEIAAYMKLFAVLDGIAGWYKAAAPWTTLLALLCYVCVCILVLFRKKLRTETGVSRVLILTAILLSLFVLVGGIAYNEIASCPTMNIGYMCGAYGIASVWKLLCIVYAVQMLFERTSETI